MLTLWSTILLQIVPALEQFKNRKACVISGFGTTDFISNHYLQKNMKNIILIHVGPCLNNLAQDPDGQG
jgi:hypothetical protein